MTNLEKARLIEVLEDQLQESSTSQAADNGVATATTSSDVPSNQTAHSAKESSMTNTTSTFTVVSNGTTSNSAPVQAEPRYKTVSKTDDALALSLKGKELILNDLTLVSPRLAVPVVNNFGEEVYTAKALISTAEAAQDFANLGFNVAYDNEQDQYFTHLERKVTNSKGRVNRRMDIVNSELTQNLDPRMVDTGSVVNVKVTMFQWEYNGETGVKPMVNALQVLHLVQAENTGVYDPAAGFVAQ